jgi:uncharacterized Fe-S cluster protein YjdI
MPEIHADGKVLEIDSVTVHRGETITVWLNLHRDRHRRNCVQIELRVNKVGQPEIYVPDKWHDKPIWKRFSRWVPLKRSPKW